MSLATQLNLQLQANIGNVNFRVEVLQGQRMLRCDVDRCDQLAATLFFLSLDTPELTGIETNRLQKASRLLAERLSYLMEPIAPIETDDQGCVVQLRSLPPHQDELGTCYYEVLLNRGGSIQLCRYQKTTGQPRTRIPAVLTHEVMGRLVGDFVATLESLA